MKNYYMILLVCVFLSSCKKENTPDVQPKAVEELLTATTWRIEESRIQAGDDPVQRYYKRGGPNNTDDRSSDSLKFKLDHTGSYFFEGKEYSVTWNFTNDEKSNMTLIVHYESAPETVYLENINVTEKYFKYAQYSLMTSKNYVASIMRSPNR